MKLCRLCQTKKSLSDFHKKTKSPDGHASECKLCKKEISAKRYKNDDAWRERITNLNLERRNRNRTYVYELLQKSSCLDCGDLRWKVLEFDHIRGKKFKGICQLIIGAYPISTIEEEIKKCEIVCANCHKLRTMERGEFAKADW